MVTNGKCALKFAFKLTLTQNKFSMVPVDAPLTRPMALLYFVFKQTSMLVPQVKPPLHLWTKPQVLHSYHVSFRR